MKIYDFKDYDKLFVIGDVHGDFGTLFFNIKQGLKYNIKAFNEKKWENKIDDEFHYDRPQNGIPHMINKDNYNNSIMVVAGDCGFGFSKKQFYLDTLKKMDKILESCNTHLLFVRGNHDDPSYFKENILNFNNIMCVDDYSVIITKNFNTLCVGGGLSLDRSWRIKEEGRINFHRGKNDKKKLYWEDEMPEFIPFELNKIKMKGINIDSLITHTAPSFIRPKDSNNEWIKEDSSLKNDLKKEKEVMNNLFKYYYENYKTKIKFWAHGHFHYFGKKKYDEVHFLSLRPLMIFDINYLSDSHLKTPKSLV